MLMVIDRRTLLVGLQIRTDKVPEFARLFIPDVMGEMCAIPDDDINAIDRLTGQPAFQESFKFGRSARHGRIGKFLALNNMPGWRNWQTHRT